MLGIDAVDDGANNDCTQLVLMREGSLIANDPPDELLRRTQTRDLSDAFVELVRETARG